MGLLKGTWSLSRFRVVGDLPEQFNDFVDESLKKYAFSNFIGINAEKCMGWTSLENILDTDFTYAKYKCGAYLIFSLRIDRVIIPASLVRLKVLEAEKQYLADKDKKKLYRHERELIKERVQLELRSRFMNIPSFFDVCWIPEKSIIMFGSLSANVVEDFDKCFKESFHLTLLPFLPWESGLVDNVSGGELINSQAMFTSPEISSIFWGREFLTWLWFKSEERGGVISMPESEDLEIIFLKRMQLVSGDGEYSEIVVCQGLHSDMNEGREALRQGKKVREAHISLTKDANKWEFTFKADSFQFQSLKLPITDNSEEDDDREGRNMERVYLVETAMEIMEQLFAHFFQLRHSPQWDNTEVPSLGKWLNQ